MESIDPTREPDLDVVRQQGIANAVGDGVHVVQPRVLVAWEIQIVVQRVIVADLEQITGTECDHLFSHCVAPVVAHDAADNAGP